METEKIYTTDNGSNFANGALMGASLNRGNSDAAALMANQFGSNWMNNPFAYLMFMMIPAIWGNGAFGGNGNQAANAQLQNLQTQIADNHNSDLAMLALQGNHDAVNQLANNFNIGVSQVIAAVSATQQAISSGLCNIRTGITEANGNVALSAQQMISNNNMQSAALGTQIAQQGNGVQKEILTQGYQNQIGNLQQSNLIQLLSQQQNQMISNGLTQIGFQIERQGCGIKEANLANTQRIIDILNNHWSQVDQNKINSLESQLALSQQTQTILSQLNSSASSAAVKTA